MGRGRRRDSRRRDAEAELERLELPRADPTQCWLCSRPMGRRVEWHHTTPKSRGGRITAAVHPICHRTMHATFSNQDLARFEDEGTPLASHPDLARFIAWIADKPADFHAPTRRRR